MVQKNKNGMGIENIYLVLSSLSGFIELGSIILISLVTTNIVEIFLAGLFYQAGNLGARIISSSDKACLIYALLGSSIFLLSELINVPFVLVYPGIFLLSLAIQNMRRTTKALSLNEANTFTKRAFRIIGFLFAGFITKFLLILAACLIVIISVYMNFIAQEKSFQFNKKPHFNKLAFIMLIHQIHYFSYCYSIPVLLMLYLNVPTYLIGLFFIVGWISYIYSEKLFKSYELRKVFILGHASVTISLIGMYIFVDQIGFFLVFWFLSGLGGGTVFCIKKLNQEMIAPISLPFWEDLGHVLGVLVTLIAIIFFGFNSRSALIIGAFFALSAGISMLLFFKNNKTELYHKQIIS